MTTSTAARLSFINILVVILIAGNLRAPITSVGPILKEILLDLNLNAVQGSLLTSIPLFVFASCSIVVSRIASRVTITSILLFSAIILLAGLCFRIYGTSVMLFIGSLFIGLGICIGNVVTPVFIKRNFPQHVGLLTGIFSVAMTVLAALASGVSVSIAAFRDSGWKASLGIWIFWSVLTITGILIKILSERRAATPVDQKAISSNFSVIRSKMAWFISIFMGLQSFLYFTIIALLPTILQHYGMDESSTGIVLTVLQLTMIPVMFLCPIVATKMKNQRPLIHLICACMLIGIILLNTYHTVLIYVAAVLIGITFGLAFSLSVVFFSLKTRTLEGTVKISGKAQSTGYFIAAFGPLLFGFLHNYDTTWIASFVLLVVVTIVMWMTGLKAAQEKFVEDY
ncbi:MULTISPECIES: CynX/NimT family MFS transporter [Sphingobacterium]|uniref:CynX/NimT family MFS transporter n=1 Tax=Sphingobacterium populi TaxID=1812824 RepID=A0ABW5UFJ4_9SPHI|nr:MFS transporter [Sphingobacterium sp. CFCC 11742]